mmetsp:Transcript_24768/g.82344  ORF Transcript_24768/g.82344 Transcript_24768/m.82344 type:complete len:322 (-) Transcript_24768:121-1086(-)
MCALGFRNASSSVGVMRCAWWWSKPPERRGQESKRPLWAQRPSRMCYRACTRLLLLRLLVGEPREPAPRLGGAGRVGVRLHPHLLGPLVVDRHRLGLQQRRPQRQVPRHPVVVLLLGLEAARAPLVAHRLAPRVVGCARGPPHVVRRHVAARGAKVRPQVLRQRRAPRADRRGEHGERVRHRGRLLDDGGALGEQLGGEGGAARCEGRLAAPCLQRIERAHHRLCLLPHYVPHARRLADQQRHVPAGGAELASRLRGLVLAHEGAALLPLRRQLRHGGLRRRRLRRRRLLLLLGVRAPSPRGHRCLHPTAARSRCPAWRTR